MTDPRLQVMICTHTHEGLQRVAGMTLPEIAGIGYVVSCQSAPCPIPPSLCREDIIVTFTSSKGLSNNRNHAMDAVTAPYALVADDDLVFDADGLKKVLEILESRPDIDIATFRCDIPGKTVYPAAEHDLRTPHKGYYVVSVEIAMRMESVRSRSLRFSPLLGIGAPYLSAAEESVFILSALRQGLSVHFFPVTIASHPCISTGQQSRLAPGVIRSTGAYASLAYPMTAPLRLPLIAYRTSGNFLENLYHLISGALYALRHRRSLLGEQ